MERIRLPEVVPLELSEVCVGDATLWEWSQGPGFPQALRKALALLRAGHAVTRSDHLVPGPGIVSGFEAVFLTGGRIEGLDLRRKLAVLPQPVVFGETPAFGGERGGFEWLQSRGLSGWVADLGKSQLKLAAPGRRWTFPRDWTRLRMSGGVAPAEEPAQRRRLREFIALKLQIAMSECGQCPRALVFALPVRLDDDGTPKSSNYAGMRGDRTLLPDALQMAGLTNVPLFVLNDAELAALSALTDPRLAGFNKVLVLTLGFGIGAALIHRARPHSDLPSG
jgi:hypothetical protein